MEDSLKRYEQAHIQKLQEERERIQQKTFTKWINSHLKKVNLKIDDIFKDLRDGKMLMSLLEVISNVNLGKRNRGTLRVQNIENINKALKYIQSKVVLENIGAEDIVDGNHRLTLGLIWTIILRFQIQEMLIESESGENKSVKDALLLWCQRKTKNYKNVDIKDFHKSWRDGLGFNALIHAHCPHLVDFDKIVPENHQKNLTQAFTIAEKELGIPNLLDSEDVDVERPDDKSIMTYVSSLYLTFAKMKTENTGAKRVGKIVTNALEVANMIDDYEKLVKSILQWIQKKIIILNDRNLPNSLCEMQKQMLEFKKYRTIEKPPKFADRSKIDEKLFQIIIKQKENNMKNYIPSEGLVIKEVEVAWENLEKAEHAREMILREELLRQEKLEQAAEKFNKKAALRESWLNEIFLVFENMNAGNSIQSIEAQINKEELIRNEICTTTERFHKLRELAINLEDNNYYDKDTISQRNDQIQIRWKKLQELVSNKQSDTGKLAFLTSTLRTLHTIRLEFEVLKPQISSTEFGKHLLAAEDLLGKHNLVDCQLKSLSDRFNQMKYKAKDFLESMKSQNLSSDQRQTLESQLRALNDDINNLNIVSQNRREQLIQNCNFHKLLSDLEEEEAWLTNQIDAMINKDHGHDYASVLRLIRRHEVYESEIDAHLPIFQKLKEFALDLCKNHNASNEEITKRLSILANGWENLNKVKNQRRNLLKDAYECQKYYADADDAHQWISEHFPLVIINENGDDEGASQALIKRHNALLEEVSAFGENDMKRLRELVILMTKPVDKHDIRPENVEKLKKMDSIEVMEKIENGMIEIPVEEDGYVDGDLNFEENQPEDENMWYSAISDYSSRDTNNRDMSLLKDEVYKVLKKSDNGWWLVETKDNKKGYVPANYLSKLDMMPKMRRPPRRQNVKISLVKKWFPIDSEIAKNYLAKKNRISMHAEIFRGPSVRKPEELHYDKINIEKRQETLENQYNELVGLTKARSFNLQGSILCHQFYKECDRLMDWMKNRVGEFNQRSSMAFDVEGTIKKYEAIIDDLAANSWRINYVNDLAGEILKIDPSTESDIVKLNSKIISKIPFPVDKNDITKKYKEINDQWEKLNYLKCEKEKSLAGASSIELFNKTGDELQETINQKLDMLIDDNVGYDKESNEALKRKFQNLLRDVDAIKNRIERFKYLGDGVRNTYPSEINYVNDKVLKIDGLYDKLQDALRKRENNLNNAANVHKFLNDSKEAEQKLNELTGIIENQIIPKDVSSVEASMQQHDSLKYEINVADNKLGNLKKLADQVIKDRPKEANILSSVGKLDNMMQALKEKGTKRTKDLEDALEAQKFYKECDQLESIISQQACKLDSLNPQLLVDDVERSLKSHANLEIFIDNINSKVQNLSDRKDQLKKNPDVDKIVNRNDAVQEKIKKLREKCQKKKVDLDNDLEFSKFNENANELNEWIGDKLKIIEDDNYKELFNLPEKLQKHKALEAEIKANITSYDKVNKWGNDLINRNHPKKDLIKEILKNAQDNWDKLNICSQDKEKKLLQAQDQNELNQDIDDILRKFDTMESSMKSLQMGTDLPSAKNLIGKQNNLEFDLLNQQDKLSKLKQKAAQMTGDNHFDKGQIEDDIKKLEIRCEKFSPCVDKHKQDLINNLKWHQFSFDVDQELQWIDEHRPLAAINDYGRSLADAVKLANKHKKLLIEIGGHKPVVNKLLDYGKALQLEVGLAYKKEIENRTNVLKNDWDRFEKQIDERKYKLDLSAEGHQLLDDFNDIDLWITEKSYYINQSDKELDNDQIETRIMKLKSINVDLATYENMLKNICQKTNDFKETCKKNHTLPELVETVIRKSNDTVDNLNYFKSSLSEKQNIHENSRDFQNFQIEISDIEGWIDEKLKIADSNEFGDDMSQMKHLKDRWDHQLKAIEIGGERIESCNKMAEQLLKNHNLQAQDIVSLQEDMLKEWNRLQQFADQKNSKFDAAEEIHKFNKACKDFSDLINIDNISLPSKSKDRNAIDSGSVRFETFTKEIEQMNGQLKGICETANKLQQKYPNHAHLIQEEVNHLQNMWQNLCEYTNQKNDELQYSIDYLNLYDKLKETLAFLKDIDMKIKTDRHINTVLAADEQLTEANECLVKLIKHDEMFKKLVIFSEDIVSDDACDNVEEIQKDIDEMLNKKNATHETLKQWIENAEKTLVQQKFYRDIHQINSSTTFQEVKVKVNNFDLDLEETEKLLIRHRNFAHNIGVTDDRVKSLCNFVENMKETNHFDIENITTTLNDCIKRRQKLHDNYGDIEIKLNDQLNWLVFLRDTDDKNFWIDEKLQQIKTLDKSANNLEEKMHLLQKYKAFEAEISANKPEFEKLILTTEEFNKNNHPKSREMKEICENIIKKWEKLLSESQYRSKVLKEAKDLLTFFDELDAIEAWHREKEFLVSANELGLDLDHCVALQAKLAEPVGGKQVDDTRIEEIIRTGEGLLQRKTVPPLEAENIKSRCKSIKPRWDLLKSELKAYQGRLDEAFKMHNYYSELGLLSDQVTDRIKLIKVKDLGTDVASVEKLRRKQNTIERDIVVLNEKFLKLKDLDAFGDKLDADHSIRISIKQKEIKDDLEELTILTNQKTNLLNLSYRFFKVENDANILKDISTKQTKAINDNGWPTDSKTAKVTLKQHEDIKGEMNTRKIKENRINDVCRKLKEDRDFVMNNIHDNTISIIPTNDQLNALQENLLCCVKEMQNCWNKRQDRLNECLQLHTFLEACEVEEQWVLTQDKKCDIIINSVKHLSSVEDVSENMEVKRSISSAISSRTKKTLNGSLLESLEKLKKDKIHDINLIENKYKILTELFSKLNEKLSHLHQTLSSEKEFQELIQKVIDHTTWIRNKLLIAADANYEDKVNLSNKMKKHKEFLSEVKANEPDIQAVVDFGKKLISENHISSVEIDQEITNLESQWTNLLEMIDFKMQRLLETNEEMLWSRRVGGFVSWLDETEKILESHDYGNDLISVEKLKRKQMDIEVDINLHKEQFQSLEDGAKKMIEGNNYLSQDIKNLLEVVNNRFVRLETFLKNHSNNLTDTELLHKFNCEVYYQIDWIQDKMQLANKSELGSSLAEADRFLKQHLSLESDILTRSKTIESIKAQALELEQRNHFAKDTIKSQRIALDNAYERLCNMKDNRSDKLKANKVYQQFSSDVIEIEMRLDDKVLLLKNFEKGSDEQSCQNLMKKIESLELEIDTEYSTVNSLGEHAVNVSSEYQNKTKELMKKLLDKLDEIKEITNTKKTIIMSNLKYYQYVRETEDILLWIKDQNSVVMIEEYGKDYDDCLNLIEKFDAYNQAMKANKNKISATKNAGKQLISEKNPFSLQIEKINVLITENMNELKENFKIRKEALQGALEVHSFVRECNDLIDWIKNKNIEISSLKNVGSTEKSEDPDGIDTQSDKTDAIVSREFNQPLSVVRKIENNFAKFERDLEAVQSQIEKLDIESSRLQTVYPDAKEHIKEKNTECERAWNTLNNTVIQKRNKLKETKQLQTWLLQFKDFLNWIKAQNIKITSVTVLPTDVVGAEFLVVINNEQKSEIDSKVQEMNKLMKAGDDIRTTAKFISQIMEEKQTHLRKTWDNMCENVQNRRMLYDQNLDLRKFFMEICDLEKWLVSNETHMNSIDEKSFKNVPEIEEASKNHDDYIKFVDGEKNKFEAVKRLTKLEDFFKQRLEEEKTFSDTLWSDDINANIKRRETQRMLQEKRRINDSVRRSGSGGVGSEIMRPIVEDVRSRKILKKQASAGQLDIQPTYIKPVKFVKDIPNINEESSMVLLDGAISKKDQGTKKTTATSFSTKKRDPMKTELVRSNSIETAANLSKNQISGLVIRKQLKTAKGIKAAVRSWKECFGVLQDHLLLFYKDKIAYWTLSDNPLFSDNIQNAEIEIAKNYTKKNFVIHIKLEDLSEMYLQFQSFTEQSQWLTKLQERPKLFAGRNEAVAQLKNISKTLETMETIKSPVIDVSSVIDIDNDLKISGETVQTHKDHKPKTIIRSKDLTKDSHDRPMTELHPKERSANRQYNSEYLTSFYQNPHRLTLSNKAPPVSLSLIKNRQLSLESKTKSSTLPLSVDTDQSHKTKPRSLMKKFFSRNNKKDGDKSDEV